MSQSLWTEQALLPEGWARHVLLQWDEAGTLMHVTPDTPTDELPAGTHRASGPLIPGMPNLHSHAFQRAFAGLTEYRDQGQDSFWTWRTLMYRFAARLSPEQMEAIATWLYIEMLQSGYTSVCEFHYIHHDADGRPYSDDGAMAHSLLRAAKRAGIGMTLLPVLYQTSGFGGTPPNEGQRRFIRSTDNMLALLDKLHPTCDLQGARLGVAPHSLRAVPPDSLRVVLAGLDSISPNAPVHIHIAEQTAEVEACLAWSGQRPVQWLMNHAQLDSRWCLVHATHMDEAEYRGAAQSGAVAGLCPTTEANLGDGIFDFPAWRSFGGAWGVGSDSHACVDPAEDLLMLEYSQRLALRRRNIGSDSTHSQVARAMWLQAVSGGAQAAGRPVQGLLRGQQADFIVLDEKHVVLQGLPADLMLASHVFASSRSRAISSVWTGGRQRIKDGLHPLQPEAIEAFVRSRTELLST